MKIKDLEMLVRDCIADARSPRFQLRSNDVFFASQTRTSVIRDTIADERLT